MTRNSPRRVVAGLSAVWLLQSAAAGAMLPFVVVWAHRTAHLHGPTAGVLFIVQAIGEFSAGVAAGSLADRFGHRRMLLFSTVGMSLGYGLLSVSGAPAPAIGLFLVAGLFESAFHPNVFALVGDTVGDEDLSRAFAVIRIGANIGAVVGPLLGALAARASLDAVFVVAGGLLVLAVVAELVFVPGDTPSRPDDDDEPEIPPGTLRALRGDRRLALLVLAGGLLSIAFTWWEADGLVLLRQQRSLSTTGYAALFTVAAVAVIVFQLPVNRMVRNLPTSWSLLAGVAVQAIGLATLVLAAHGYAFLVIAVVLMASGQMIYGPVLQTYVTRRAGPDRRATYQAALSITEDIGTAVGPVTGLALGGAVGGALGARAVWTTGAVLCCLAGIGSRVATANDRVESGGAAVAAPELSVRDRSSDGSPI